MKYTREQLINVKFTYSQNSYIIKDRKGMSLNELDICNGDGTRITSYNIDIINSQLKSGWELVTPINIESDYLIFN